jgi:hypothetical protein
MIIDSHTHAWARWPTSRPSRTGEPGTRGATALGDGPRGRGSGGPVCARIEQNPGNNDYVAECVQRYPDRLVQFADVDSQWLETYHTPGAARRLAEAATQVPAQGLHPLLKNDYDWLESPDGLAFFRDGGGAEADREPGAECGVDARAPEARSPVPTIPFLCHHMAGARVGEGEPARQLKRLSFRGGTNLYIKLFRLPLCLRRLLGLPLRGHPPHHPQALRKLRAPSACAGAPTIRSALRHDLPSRAGSFPHPLPRFVLEADRERILGGNLERLLDRAGV